MLRKENSYFVKSINCYKLLKYIIYYKNEKYKNNIPSNIIIFNAIKEKLDILFIIEKINVNLRKIKCTKC